uniref:Uncharacterized protein n=1 Tax=Grammatophora oceanica TaxID=210454 RepID=A0A7S1UT90_9STRA
MEENLRRNKVKVVHFCMGTHHRKTLSWNNEYLLGQLGSRWEDAAGELELQHYHRIDMPTTAGSLDRNPVNQDNGSSLHHLLRPLASLRRREATISSYIFLCWAIGYRLCYAYYVGTLFGPELSNWREVP